MHAVFTALVCADADDGASGATHGMRHTDCNRLSEAIKLRHLCGMSISPRHRQLHATLATTPHNLHFQQRHRVRALVCCLLRPNKTKMQGKPQAHPKLQYNRARVKARASWRVLGYFSSGSDCADICSVPSCAKGRRIRNLCHSLWSGQHRSKADLASEVNKCRKDKCVTSSSPATLTTKRSDPKCKPLVAESA